MGTLRFEYDGYVWFAEIARRGGGRYEEFVVVGRLLDDSLAEVPRDSPLGEKLGEYVRKASTYRDDVREASRKCCR